MSAELLEIVNANPYFEILETGKLRCKLTNHEVAPDLAKYNEYINSKGYQKAIEKDFDFKQFLPHITPFKGQEEHFLWCKLTRTKVPKMKQVLLRHVQGKKYQRLLSIFDEKNKERQERKKITLFKSKVLSKEEDDEKFDGDFIDQMLNEFEEDEKLQDKELDGDESYSEDLYVKVSKKANGENDDEEEEEEIDEEAEESEDDEEMDEEDQEDEEKDEEGDQDEENEIVTEKVHKVKKVAESSENNQENNKKAPIIAQSKGIKKDFKKQGNDNQNGNTNHPKGNNNNNKQNGNSFKKNYKFNKHNNKQNGKNHPGKGNQNFQMNNNHGNNFKKNNNNAKQTNKP